MYLVGALVLAILVYFIFFNKGKTTPTAKVQSSNNSNGSSDSQGGGKSFLPPIPSGYQIYAGNPPVAGIQHRRVDAIKFANSSNQELALQRESNNEYDPNAIKLTNKAPSE